MDVKQSVATLQARSEQLRKITTDLSVDLSKLRLSFSEREGDSETEELKLLGGLAELNSSLFAATEVFYQLLRRFLAKGRTGNGLASERESH